MSFDYECEQFYFRVTSNFVFNSEIRVQYEQLMCFKVQVDHGLSIKDTYRYDQEGICRYFGKFALNIGSFSSKLLELHHSFSLLNPLVCLRCAGV